MTRSLYLVAAEQSGDDLGAGLISEIRKKNPGIIFSGIGGARMAELGIKSPFDISPLSILGFVEAIKAYPMVRKLVRQSVTDIMQVNPDMVILIDSWGFMIRVAASLRVAGYKGQIVKYVAPQVWAMREGRARVLADKVDHLMTIHSFDAEYFERHGLDVTYVGNPLFDTDYNAGSGREFRQEHAVVGDEPCIVIMFGSRPAELERLAEPFAAAIERIKSSVPNSRFFTVVSDSIRDEVHAAVSQDSRLKNIVLLPESEKINLFAASDVALACSGTVTTQLACAGVPTVVGYKLNGLTFFFAKRLFKPNYISLVNIAADQALMPEFVQSDCNGDVLADAVLEFVQDKDLSRSTSKALLAHTKNMKGGDMPANQKVAKTVLDLLGV